MYIKELNLVKKIFKENEISHSIEYIDDKPANIYSINALYKTEDNEYEEKPIITIIHISSIEQFELYIDEQIIFMKKFRLGQPISILKKQAKPSEDSIIKDIIRICQNKTSNKYIRQLKEIHTNLRALSLSNNK